MVGKGVVIGIFLTGIIVGSIGLLCIRLIQSRGVVATLFAQSPPVALTTTPTPVPFVCFSGCIVSSAGSDYSGSGFGNRFAGKDLSNAYIDSLYSQGGNDFSHVNFTNAWLYHLYTDKDNWQGANFTNAWMFGSTLGSDFTDANFTGAKLNWATLLGNFTHANFTNVDFTNADLSSGTFAGANFSGSVWGNTACRDGTNSNNNHNTCIGHLAPNP